MSLRKASILLVLPLNVFRAASTLAVALLSSTVSASGQNYIYQQLYAFGDNTIGYARNTNGYSPQGALVEGTDGLFYGTCAYGGQPTTNNPAGGYGTVFKMTPDGGLTTLGWFGYTNGAYPFGAMIQAKDGNFYGTAGGTFRLTQDGSLAGATGGDLVGDPYEGTDGFIYAADGYYDVVYWSSPDGYTNGLVYVSGHPSGGLIQASDGNFYGLTVNGGAFGFGTAYRLRPGGVLTTLVSFGGTNIGRWPCGKMLQASDGNLYGVCDFPEQVFKLTLNGTLSTFAAFGTNGDWGNNANGGLIEATDGNFYGTTAYGGRSPEDIINMGTIFKISPDGNITTLFSFTQQGGSCPGQTPLAGLVQGSDGNLYGTCAYGGDYGGGNIFRVIMPGPLLTVRRSGDQLILSWRTNYVGFKLQSSDSLSLPNWAECTNSAVISGGHYCVTNAVSPGSRFFRLGK